MKKSLIVCGLLIGLALIAQATCGATANAFDHEYRTFAAVLKKHVRFPRVDHAALKADRVQLDRVVAEFESPAARGEPRWTREQRMAFWINAYNVFTLRAVLDHYPIRGSWLSLAPRNSIKQIDGVWTRLTWQAAGRRVTLDDIEHRILRPASRAYLASGEGLRGADGTFQVSSLRAAAVREFAISITTGVSMTPLANSVFVLTAFFLLPLGAQTPAGPSPPPITLFFEAASPDADVSERALDALSPVWKDTYTALLVDLARFLPSSRPDAGVDVMSLDPETGGLRSGDARAALRTPAARTRARIVRFLERHTKQRFGDDLGRWREWMWRLPDEPHPEFAAFKAELYARIDPRMRLFFPPGVAASIRLDEIDWGGVPINGIPPLEYPRVIAAAEASYLKDSHIVFGVVINGEARAYPRRVLAWHEMARDRLGGLEITVVYCTLCGTVIPYESVVGGRTFTFGTSGLLYRSNKLMFDQETASLWSTLDGSPAVGSLVGSGLRLKARPVVTTTWGEWRAEHPATTVLSLETGHTRDYSEGAAYREYFENDRLMFRVPKLDTRLKNKDEILGVLVPAPGGGRQAAAFDVRLLAKQRVFETSVEGRRFVIVTSARGANRVYEAGDVRFAPRPTADSVISDLEGRRWQVTEEALVLDGAAQQLARVPAWRAFWFGWYAQFPETLLLK